MAPKHFQRGAPGALLQPMPLEHGPTAVLPTYQAAQFSPLESVTRPTVDTEAAAFYLNRRPQTLRVWAMGSGPILPLRINGRLAWRVSDLKRLLEVA